MTKLINLLNSIGRFFTGEADKLAAFDAKARAQIQSLVNAGKIKAGLIGLGVGFIAGFIVRG